MRMQGMNWLVSHRLPHLVTGRTQQCRIPDPGSFTHYGGFHNRNDWQKNAGKMQILATKRSPLRGTLSKHYWTGSWAPRRSQSMQAPHSTLRFYLHYPCLPNTHTHHTDTPYTTRTTHTHARHSRLVCSPPLNRTWDTLRLSSPLGPSPQFPALGESHLGWGQGQPPVVSAPPHGPVPMLQPTHSQGSGAHGHRPGGHSQGHCAVIYLIPFPEWLEQPYNQSFVVDQHGSSINTSPPPLPQCRAQWKERSGSVVSMAGLHRW